VDRDAVVSSVFTPVRAATTFEETVERLGTAIRTGILPAGSRLPAERTLADELGISRSTLRQALTTLVQSGHYRRADIRFHIGLAEAARAPRLVSAMTEVQGRMSELITRIAHPPEVLTHANDQHRRVVRLLRKRDSARAVQLIREHMEGTEHILAGLL
jgi:DNA-binding FadR family transcriptional regulator